MTRTTMSETALQQHLVKLMEAYGRPDIEWHCVPNDGERHPAVAKRLRLMGVKRGVADLVFLIDGRCHGLELKTEIGTQSGHQSEWQERFERAGGFYHIAFGLDQAITILKTLNVFQPNISISIPSADGRAVRSPPWRSSSKAGTHSTVRT